MGCQIKKARQGTMSKLNLSIAIGDYDRNRPLIDGAVQMDGVDPVFMTLSPEEIFFRGAVLGLLLPIFKMSSLAK